MIRPITTAVSLAVIAMLSGCASTPVTSDRAALETIATAVNTPELLSREVLFGNPDRASVLMSPDGKYLSWTAPVDGVMNVWVAPSDNVAGARAVTSDTARGIRNYFWSYQSGVLLYLRDTGGDEDFHLYSVDVNNDQIRDLTPFERTTASVAGVSADHPGVILVGMNDRDPRWHDLYRVNLLTGERELVEKNTDNIGDYVVDSNYVPRYASRAKADGGMEVLRKEGNQWVQIDEIPFEDVMTTSLQGLSNDGSVLYLIDSRQRDTAALYSIEQATGKKTLLHEDARADIAGAVIDPMTGKPQAVAVNYLRRELTVLDATIAEDLKRLQAIGPGEASINSRTADDTVWIIAYSAAESPVEYYRYDRAAGGTLTHLFSGRPALEGKPLVPMWPQEIVSRDGLTLVSYLTLPAEADTNKDGKADKAVPLVLTVHGGPWARDSYGFNSRAQWLANRGYASLSVNFRGSTGFGKRFTNAGDGEWAAKMHDDLIDAVQWAVKSGITTPDKVAIMGGSYGGYATLVGLTFTPDVFACGVDIVGPSNLNTLLSTVPPHWASFFEQLARRMGDPRTEEGRAWLTERSPLSRVEAIKKPLLIGQGANDPRVKQDESDQIVNAMTEKNIPVTYVLFPDEGHGFHRPENNKAFNAVTEGFLGECLGGRVEPIGNEFEGSSISVPTGATYVKGLAEALKAHQQAVKH